MTLSSYLTIGDLAERSGVAPSALRFYESRGLIASERTEGNQRRFARATLRRVAVVRAARAIGVSLDEIAAALEALPRGRAPAKRDRDRLSRSWHRRLERRIAELERVRDDLTSCIGCGCLSLRTCALFNPSDGVAVQGPGPRLMMQRLPEA